MSLKEYFFDNKHQIILNAKTKPRNTKLITLGFSKLYFLFNIQKFSRKVFAIVLISIFVGICNFFLIHRTGLYSVGIASIFQAIARLIFYFLKYNNHDTGARAIHTIIFWGMYLAFNVPFAILGFRKIGRKFTTLTLLYLTISNCTSIFLSSLPQRWGLTSFYVFSDPRTFNTALTDQGINILQWNYFTVLTPENSSALQTASASANPVSFVMNDSSRVSIIFLYGIVYGLLNTAYSIVIYSIGGSLGGVDWIVYYSIKKKKKKTSNFYFYVGLLIAFSSYVLGTYVPYSHYILTTQTAENAALNNQYHSVISCLFGPVLMSTLLAAITKKIMFHLFYPHLKIIAVKVFTNKAVDFRNQLLKFRFPHPFTINTAIGGYMLRNQVVFEIICFALDLRMLKECANKIDPSSLIIATPVKSMDGRLAVMDNIS